MDFIIVLLINIVRILKYAIIARVLMSWIQVDRSNRLVIFTYQATEPTLRFFRKILPRFGMIDLSPLIAFIALDFLQVALLSVISDVI